MLFKKWPQQQAVQKSTPQVNGQGRHAQVKKEINKKRYNSKKVISKKNHTEKR